MLLDILHFSYIPPYYGEIKLANADAKKNLDVKKAAKKSEESNDWR